MKKLTLTQLSVLSLVAALILVLAPIHAGASISSVRGVRNLGCGGEDLRQSAPLLYSAKFQLGGVNRPVRKMRVMIAMSAVKQGGFNAPFPIAQIWSGNQCQAVCKVASIEKDTPLTPVAVEMSCEAMGFSPLAVKASILWGGEKSAFMAKKPTIRFGTWLEGYRDSALNVELDRYSMSTSTNRALAKMPSHTVAGR